MRTSQGRSITANICLSQTISTGDFLEFFQRCIFFTLFIRSVYFNRMCKLVLGSLLSVKLERWLQLMLKWSPQERGKDPEATPNDCFSQLGVILQLKVYYPFYLFRFFLWACKTCSTMTKNQLTYTKCKSSLSVNYLWFFFSMNALFHQLVHVLNMMSAKILSYSVSDDETVADLQLRIEKDSNIAVADQELLLEAGLALEPQALATQCAMDYSVILNSLWTMQTEQLSRSSR